MGSSSNSSTRRTYNTTNTSQQGESNVYGNNNRTTIQRADAVTLDNVAAALRAAMGDLTDATSDAAHDYAEAGTDQVRRVVEAAREINADSLDAMSDTSGDAIDMAERVNADSLDAVSDTSQDAIDLAREVSQAGENSTQRAMDFAANYSERAQVGNAGEATRTVVWVAAVAGVALVGVAWASKGSMKA